MTEETIQVEADSLEEAKKKLQAQVPRGFVVISTELLQEPIPKTTLTFLAVTMEEAFEAAELAMPANVEVIEKKELSQLIDRTFDVEEFDEQAARSQAKTMMSDSETIVELTLKTPGKKGILGMGRKPNIYEVKVFQPAEVEVTYKRPIKIRATLGDDLVRALDQIWETHARGSHINMTFVTFFQSDEVVLKALREIPFVEVHPDSSFSIPKHIKASFVGRKDLDRDILALGGQLTRSEMHEVARAFNKYADHETNREHLVQAEMQLISIFAKSSKDMVVWAQWLHV